jgi:ketopantoate reductase
MNDHGVVHYAQIRQQRTSIGKADGTERLLVEALRRARFPVAVVADMPAWLTTHSIFITGVGAAILLRGGDSTSLADDRSATARMIRAVPRRRTVAVRSP